MRVSALALSLAAAASVAGTVAPMASAATPPQNYYRHGVWAQSHASTMSGCTALQQGVMSALTRNQSVATYKVNTIKLGACHEIRDEYTGKFGYVYDVTYKANKPLWASDANFGTTLERGEGAHSFMVYGRASSEAARNSQVAAITNAVKPLNGGVGLSSVARAQFGPSDYRYTVSYDSIYAHGKDAVEVSEKPGVKATLLGPPPVMPRLGTPVKP